MTYADLVKIALQHYVESGAKLSPDEEILAMKDFENFYKTIQTISPFYNKVLGFGIRGIRWNFNGCICCENTGKDIGKEVRLQRVLIVHPSVISAANGRALGTVLCEIHSPLIGNGFDTIDDAVISGALKRIKEEPPK